LIELRFGALKSRPQPVGASRVGTERSSELPLPGAFIGTAGWNVPAPYAPDFCATGTHLQRYATRMNAVEINSSFYRPHRRQTYERWAASVPKHFRFSVKIPKEITHARRLDECDAQLDRFAVEVGGLGASLGVVLVQLPPSLAFDETCASRFFAALKIRITSSVGVACEPRHPSWFTHDANTMLACHEVARVSADPPRAADDGAPGGWQGLAYYRLHGSPRIYYSNYDDDALEKLSRLLADHRTRAAQTWCIFDNTAAFAALGNALALCAMQLVS
jgi:uncharacterized protein YecE (DUF72 family)